MSTIGAGADTTGGTLTYTLYLLAKNPQAKEKLYGELRDAVDQGVIGKSSSGEPRWKWNEVNTKMPYLDAVLKESMRLIPIAAWGLDRVVPAQVSISPCYFSEQALLTLRRVLRFPADTSRQAPWSDVRLTRSIRTRRYTEKMQISSGRRGGLLTTSSTKRP